MNRPFDPRDAHQPPALRQADQGQRLRATPPAMPRRVVDAVAPGGVRRPGAEPAPRIAQKEGRRMVVARDITLSGQISKCDHLVVEGCVEGMRYDGQSLHVIDGGVFNGTIEVDDAEIAGSYEGTMTVRGQLTIRASGRVSGTIRYGEIEINAGGQINGELESIKPVRSARGNNVESILSDLQQDGETSEPRATAAGE